MADVLEALKTLGRLAKARQGVARPVAPLKTPTGTVNFMTLQKKSIIRNYSTIAEQEEYPRGKRIDYILHSAGRGRNCKVTWPIKDHPVQSIGEKIIPAGS